MLLKSSWLHTHTYTSLAELEHSSPSANNKDIGDVGSGDEEICGY